MNRANFNVSALSLTFAVTCVLDVAGTWEVLSKLVKGSRHDTVCCVKCLLYAITVVYVDINIQNAHVSLQELNAVRMQCLVSYISLVMSCTPSQKWEG